MPNHPPIDPLLALSALRTSGTATQSDLDAALHDIRTTVSSGQSWSSILSGAHHDVLLASRTASVPHVAESVRPAASVVPRFGMPIPIEPLPAGVAGRRLVSVRTLPVAAADPLARDWSRAQTPNATRGPFVNDAGQRFWIDTFVLPELVDIVATTGIAGAARLLARLPLRRGRPPVRRRQLAAGSVWLSANVLVKNRPPSEFVGARVTGGSLELQGVSSVSGSVVTLGGAWRMKIVLKLVAPPQPAPATGPGVDAANAVVTLPATVTITLDASGALSIDLAEAKANAYGTTVDFDAAPSPPFYDALSRSIVVPCTASSPQFNFTTVRSTSVRIAGSAPIARSGWALLVAVTTPPALGEASGAGFLWLELGGPLRVEWTGLPKPALVPHSVLGLAPGSIGLWADVVPGDVTHHLRLWDETGSSPLRQSSVDVTSIAGSTIFYLTQPGSEALVFMGKAVGHFDRPLVADGGRVPARMPLAWFVLLQLPADTTAGVIALDPDAMNAPHIAFALENAFLKTRPPVWLTVFGGTLDGDQLESGFATLYAPYRAVVPMLPDPYAANFESSPHQDFDPGWAAAMVAWSSPPVATLAFSVQGPQGQLLPPQGAAVLSAFFATREGNAQPGFVLLDVSSNADQFGVVIPRESRSVGVAGLTMVASARDVAVLTLPPISWEPMFSAGPSGGDPPLPPPPHDGGIAAFVADATDITPVEPVTLLDKYLAAVNHSRHFAARLPLPFGLIAHLDTRVHSDAPESTFIADGNAMFLNRPAFAHELLGGLQLAITGPANDDPHARDKPLPGGVDLVDDNQYAKGVLSENIYTRFKGDFGADKADGVPVRRYELSGYGASLLSDWRDPEAVGPAIIEARFDVFVGRTSHEVIQMQSILYPWWIKVVRTITMDRTRGGWILREDTGWVATNDGRFGYQGDPNALAEPPPATPPFPGNPLPPAFTADNIHPGAIEALVNVRNIQLVGAQFPLPPAGGSNAVIWQAVTFDADVVFVEVDNPLLVVRGGSSARRVPSRGITGWIEIDAPIYHTLSKSGEVVKRPRPASAADVFGLLAVQGPARAPIDCTVAFGGTQVKSGLVVRASSIDVRCADDAVTPRLAAAVRGSPLLPRNGAWSLARRAATDPAPSALDPSFPVPIVRPTAPATGSQLWHLADPIDILKLDDAANPSVRYGLVQSLGTQKVFFERPRVNNAAAPVTLPQPPKLADMGALLNAAGVFPGLADSFDFKTLKALSASEGNLGFSETFPIGAGEKKALLANLGVIQVQIEYHDEHEPDVPPPVTQPTKATITVDPDPNAAVRWSLFLSRVCFAVQYNNKPLISIFADVKADAKNAPTVANINVRYEGILGALQSIFTNIQQVARFLPGGEAAGLKVGFSQGHLTVRNAFALPTLPLGTGQITDVAVDMGFDVALSPFDIRFVAGLGSEQNPFRWIVSPLAGTGVVQVAVGNKGLDVLVQGGLGVGLAIDLGIASGSASVALAVQLNTGPDPFEIKGILSGRASVDVLQGLASATITLAAGLGIVPPPQLFKPPFLPPSVPPHEIPELTITLIASVAAGIHISVCWVVDVDWDGYWQFRQDINTPKISLPV
jgi:hypothetical protein